MVARRCGCYLAGNDIDGEVLEESDIAQLIPSIGARRKFNNEDQETNFIKNDFVVYSFLQKPKVVEPESPRIVKRVQ